MILCYDELGRIFLTYNDPIAKGLEKVLSDNGTSFIHYKPEDGTKIYGSEVINLFYVVDGVVVPRPECPVSVSVKSQVVSLADVPVGSKVLLVMDAGTPFEMREEIKEYTIEFDEHASIKFVVAAPFPYRVKVYDVEI